MDKNSTDINRHKVQIETGEKMVKKLTKGIEESKKEKERILEGKEKLRGIFKEIEQKAFTVQENYEKMQKVFIFLPLPCTILYGKYESKVTLYKCMTCLSF